VLSRLPRNAPAWLDRLSEWLEPFEVCFTHVAQRGAFRRYLLGLLSEVNVLGTFTYTYDGTSSRVATVGYPNNQTSTYSYYPALNDHRLQTIHHQYPGGATLSKFDYTYDATGNILTWRQQADNEAVLWAYWYDTADQLIGANQHDTMPQQTVLKRYAYAYDPGGNRTLEQIDDTVTGASHDSMNRLVGQQPAGGLRFVGTVSEPSVVTVQGSRAVVAGDNTFRAMVPVASGTNVISVTATDPSGNSASREYEVDNLGTPQTFTYDANANLTSDGTRTFEWDARNQLVAINEGTHRSEFGYDGEYRRVRIVEKENGATQSDTRVVWCDKEICEAVSSLSVSTTQVARLPLSATRFTSPFLTRPRKPMEMFGWWTRVGKTTCSPPIVSWPSTSLRR
jgi:YD repeat-containing protein